MRSWLKHPARVSARLLWLGAEFVFAGLSFVARCVLSRKSGSVTRAEWLQYHSRRVLRVFHLDAMTSGAIPSQGLLICNHLSYLDIVVIAALSPCVFVAKCEVRNWPVFGWFARLAGTIFVDRGRRTHAVKSVWEIEAALRAGVLVVLFPEGTSSGGKDVLPFKSTLLEPAARQNPSLTAALIQYELADGDVSEEVCYWKDMTLVPHLINLLGKRVVISRVRFTGFRRGSANRKELARQLHSEILRMKEAVAV